MLTLLMTAAAVCWVLPASSPNPDVCVRCKLLADNVKWQASGVDSLPEWDEHVRARRFGGINMATLTVANLLFSPTFLILVAASAALVISVGITLTWPRQK
jgi:hypothetical protein